MIRRLVAALLIALIVAVFGVRRCSRPDDRSPAPAPPAPERTDLPAVFVPSPPAPPTSPVLPPVPDRLRPYLEALGKAGVLRDLRRLAELRRSTPEVFESDFPWLVEQLRGELFAAAGAADLLVTLRPQAAVAAMAPRLAEPGRSFLKDALIDQLTRAGGDGAAVALIAALQADAEERIRARCARALEAFQGPEAYAALVLALTDVALDVRRAAATSLGAMRSPEIIKVLLAALLRESNYKVQADLFTSVHRILGADGDLLQGLERAARQLSPAAREELLRRRASQLQALLERPWPLGFFTPGRDPVPFDPAGRRIGLTVELGPGIRMSEVAQAIFAEPPFDRYRDWFYLRNEAEFPSTMAYDYLGRPLEGVAHGELEGAVYLRFRDPAHFARGVLGYARGCEAFVQKISLLHEIGHALGGLGDEYKGGTPPPQANLSTSRAAPWDPLVRGGHLPQPFLRQDGVWVPSETCHMNNNAVGEVDYCPVCQLALIGRIAELTDAPLPVGR